MNKAELLSATRRLAQAVTERRVAFTRTASECLGFVPSDIESEVDYVSQLLTERIPDEVLSLARGRTPICAPGEHAVMMLPANSTSWSVVEIARAALVGNQVRARMTARARPVAQLVQEVFDDVIPGVVHVEREMSGPEFLTEALDSESAPFIMVWGGEALGDELLERAARGPRKRVVMEGPGKDPAVILAGAEHESVAQQLCAAKFALGGQTCTAPENVIVHQSIHDPLVETLVRRCREEQPAEVFSNKVPGTVRGQLADAVERGAEIVVGGKVDGNMVWPTVVTGVTREMKLFQDETFAPVFALCRFDAEDEGVAIARDTRFGLRTTVIGTDAERVANLLTGAAYAEPVEELVYGKYGMKAINKVLAEDDSAIFGGYGKSGWVWDGGDLLQGPKAVAREATVPAL